MQDPWIKKRFHTNDEAQSNSKSEDTPLDPDKQKLISENLFDLIEPPQDSPLGQVTSLEKQVEELVESIWFDGENGGFDGSSVHEWYQKESKQAQKEYVKDILKLLKQQQIKLIERIESEVIKPDASLEDIYGSDRRNNYGSHETEVRDAARWLQRRQREAINKLKESL